MPQETCYASSVSLLSIPFVSLFLIRLHGLISRPVTSSDVFIPLHTTHIIPPPPPPICKSSAKNRIYSQNASGFFGDLAVFTAAPSVPDGQVPFCKKSPSVFSDRGAFPHFPSIERGTFLLTEQRPQPSAHPRGRCSPTSRPGPRGPCGRRRPACGRWACAGQDHG